MEKKFADCKSPRLKMKYFCFYFLLVLSWLSGLSLWVDWAGSSLGSQTSEVWNDSVKTIRAVTQKKRLRPNHSVQTNCTSHSGSSLSSRLIVHRGLANIPAVWDVESRTAFISHSIWFGGVGCSHQSTEESSLHLLSKRLSMTRVWSWEQNGAYQMQQEACNSCQGI